MSDKNTGGRMIKNLKTIGIVILADAVVIALICLLGGWMTWLGYSNGLTFAGGFFIVAGGLSLLSSEGFGGRKLKYRHLSAGDSEDTDVESDEDTAKKKKNFNFFIIMSISGVLSILLSILVAKIGGW